MLQIKDILLSTMKKMNCKQQFIATQIFMKWENIVGEDISKHTSPGNIQQRVLIIHTENSVWCHHLTMLKSNIIKNINDFFQNKVIDDIKFFAGKIHNFEKQDKLEEVSLNEKKLKIILTKEKLKKIKADACIISNLDLRKKVIRLAIAREKNLQYKKSNNWHKCKRCDSLCPENEKYCNCCNLQVKREIIDKIKTILLELPWINYKEMKTYLNCNNYDYIIAKSEIISIILSKISRCSSSKIEEITFAMLLVQKKPDEMNESICHQIVDRYRRKPYVSAFRC